MCVCLLTRVADFSNILASQYRRLSLGKSSSCKLNKVKGFLFRLRIVTLLTTETRLKSEQTNVLLFVFNLYVVAGRISCALIS